MPTRPTIPAVLAALIASGSLLVSGVSAAPGAKASSCVMSPGLGEYVTYVYDAACPTLTINVPERGVRATRMAILILGAGGGGGGPTSPYPGGAGGSGARVWSALSTSGATSISVTLGQGGTAGSIGHGGRGGGSSRVSIGATDALVAGGGGGGGAGINPTGSAGGAGGATSADGAGGATSAGEGNVDGSGGAAGDSYFETSLTGSSAGSDAAGGAGGAASEAGAHASISLAFMLGPNCTDADLDAVFAGSGTEVDPFSIATEADLQAMSGCSFNGKYVRQAGNITTDDMWPVKDGSAGPFSNMTSDAPAASPFGGVFNGNDHSITFSLAADQPARGVFYRTRGARISNLSVIATSQPQYGSAGWLINSDNWPLCAGVDNEATETHLTDVSVTVSSGSSGADGIATFAGGLVGQACQTVIRSSSVSGNSSANSAGGFVGSWSQEIVIEDSFSSVDLPGFFTGGFVGPSSSGVSVSDSYSTGAIGPQGGGIIGLSSTDAVVTNVYTTGSIALGAGGIIGASATNPSVNHAYTSGAGDGLGGIIAGSSEDGSNNFSETSHGSSGFNVTNFASVAVGWRGGSYAGAIWALCPTVSPTLPYLTAMYAADPCASPSPSPEPSGLETPSPPSPLPQVSPLTLPVGGAVPAFTTPPAAQPATVTPGGLTMLVAGMPITVRQEPVGPRGGFSLSGGDIQVSAIPPPSGFSVGSTSTVVMSGYAPDTQVGAFLFSAPLSLGTLKVGKDGLATGSVVIPASVPPGNHTLQFTGWTPTREPVVLSAGITVKPQVKRVQERVTFAVSSRLLNKQGRASITRVIAESAALVQPTRTVVTYPGSGAPDQVRLAQSRAKTVAAMLRSNGLVGPIAVAKAPVRERASRDSQAVAVTVTGAN